MYEKLPTKYEKADKLVGFNKKLFYAKNSSS